MHFLANFFFYSTRSQTASTIDHENIDFSLSQLMGDIKPEMQFTDTFYFTVTLLKSEATDAGSIQVHQEVVS